MTRPRRLALELQKRFAPSRYAFNVLRGYPMANPVMQMNIYNVGELALYLMRRGAINVGLAPVPAAWPGVYLLFHKGNALDAAQWWGPGAEGRA